MKIKPLDLGKFTAACQLQVLGANWTEKRERKKKNASKSNDFIYHSLFIFKTFAKNISNYFPNMYLPFFLLVYVLLFICYIFLN